MDHRPKGCRYEASLASLLVAGVRMTNQAGTPIFDSSERVQPEYRWATYEIRPCYPDVYYAAVVTTAAGRLVSQP